MKEEGVEYSEEENDEGEEEVGEDEEIIFEDVTEPPKVFDKVDKVEIPNTQSDDEIELLEDLTCISPDV